MKISNIYLLSLSIMCISITNSFSMDNPCEKEGDLATDEEAKECLEHRLKNDTGLYKLVKNSKHLGNTKNNCEDDKGNKTYFSKNKDSFNEAIASIKIHSCQVDTNPSHLDTYRCIGTTDGPACYRKNQPTTTIAAGVGIKTKKITTIYPTRS